MASGTFANLFNGITRVGRGIIESNGTMAIDNSEPTAIFLISLGSWNISYVLLVAPAAGGAPVVTPLMSIGGGTYYDISANGQWGINVKNTHPNARSCTVYKISRV